MNKIVFNHPKIENGKEMSFSVPYGEESRAYIDSQISELFLDEHYEKGRIKKDMVIMDVGANIGLASVYFKDYAKVIYALEPNPENYECLVENVKDYSHIKTYNTGLTTRTGNERLIKTKVHPIAETLFGKGEKSYTVKFHSIGDFMNENGIEHVDLMKFDTEGSEYLVFPSQSFAECANKIDYIVGETHYIDNLAPEYVETILKELGYDFEFLPFTNMERTFTFSEGTTKIWKFPKQTIFFAKRKHDKTN